MATLKEIRKAQGLSQLDLAHNAGVSPGVIHRIEHGEAVQRTSVMLVALALRIEPDSIEGVIIADRIGE